MRISNRDRTFSILKHPIGKLLISGVFVVCLFAAPILPVLSGPVEAAVLDNPAQGSSLTVNSPGTTASSESISDPLDNLPQISLNLSGQRAIVFESGRMRVLYENNSSLPSTIPISAKLMTAIITAEQLQPETMVTISSVAASVPDQAIDMGQPLLRTGEKYSYEYLLLRMLFYDSDAAALALAEQVSGEESVFIEQMNSKAKSLELTDTKFSRDVPLTSPSTETSAQDGTTLRPDSALLAVTTLRDLARLLAVAMQNSFLNETLQKNSEYQVLEGQVVVSMHHQMEPLWTLSDGRVDGVLFSDREGSTTLSFGEVNGIPVVTLVDGGLKDQAINDTLDLYNAIEHTYEVATLVEMGDHFFGSQEKTLDGETFGLIYLKTMTYVRPIGQDFLKSTVQYQSFGPFSRPILSGAVIGQAIFQLLDGTTIAVDVGPDRQILSSVSLYDRALKQLQSNPNLTTILLGMLALLALIFSIKIIFGLTRLMRLARLLLLEIRSRR